MNVSEGHSEKAKSAITEVQQSDSNPTLWRVGQPAKHRQANFRNWRGIITSGDVPVYRMSAIRSEFKRNPPESRNRRCSSIVTAGMSKMLGEPVSQEATVDMEVSAEQPAKGHSPMNEIAEYASNSTLARPVQL
jgi:hypothetical protein